MATRIYEICVRVFEFVSPSGHVIPNQRKSIILKVTIARVIYNFTREGIMFSGESSPGILFAFIGVSTRLSNKKR